MTQADKSRQRLYEVSDAMLLAIDSLVTGATTIDAAEAGGVTRQTVSGWRNRHAGFQARLNQRRMELLDERCDRVRDLDAQALEVIADAIQAGDRTHALAWLKMRGLHAVDVTEVGPAHASEIVEANTAPPEGSLCGTCRPKVGISSSSGRADRAGESCVGVWCHRWV